MTFLYQLIVFVHVASIMLLLLLHGGAMAATYAARAERAPERLGAILDLSRITFDSRAVFGRVFWANLLVVVFSGGILMAVGGHWRHGWPWLSIVVLVAIYVAMTRMGSQPMGELRRASGLPFIAPERRGRPQWHEPEPADEAAIEAARSRLNPAALTATGAGGFLVLLWLMMYKPF